MERNIKLDKERRAGKSSKVLNAIVQSAAIQMQSQVNNSRLTQLLRAALTGVGRSMMLLALRADQRNTSYSTLNFAIGQRPNR